MSRIHINQHEPMQRPNGKAPFVPIDRRKVAMPERDEERIRRAVRHVIQRAREEHGQADVQYVFDLLSFLRPDVHAVVEDETARTFAELVGGT